MWGRIQIGAWSKMMCTTDVIILTIDNGIRGRKMVHRRQVSSLACKLMTSSCTKQANCTQSQTQTWQFWFRPLLNIQRKPLECVLLVRVDVCFVFLQVSFPSISLTAFITFEWAFEFQKETSPSFLWIFIQTLGNQLKCCGKSGSYKRWAGWIRNFSPTIH
jgi:hypothetical protein